MVARKQLDGRMHLATPLHLSEPCLQRRQIWSAGVLDFSLAETAAWKAGSSRPVGKSSLRAVVVELVASYDSSGR